MGTKQGTGTVTLNDNIDNYRFIFIKIGYYQSGYPNFGNICLPVTCIPRTTDSEFVFTISCANNSQFAGTTSIRFDTSTVLNVLNIWNAERYVVCHGIS